MKTNRRKAYLKAYRATHKEEAKAYNKEYQKTDKRRAYQKEYYQKLEVKARRNRETKEYRLKNPEKVKAHNATYYRKLRGTECNVCGSTKNLDGHHPDYSQPEVVVTLCREHHTEVHTN